MVMSLGVVRFRTVADVVVTFMEAGAAIPDEALHPWFEALSAGSVSKTMICSLGALELGSRARRRMVDVLTTQGVRVVGLTDEDSNKRIVASMSFLGVQITSYTWAEVRSAARDLAGDSDGAKSIVRAVVDLRAESPAFIPDSG